MKKHFTGLLEDSDLIEHRKAEGIHKELQRTKSILAAQIGIIYPNSLWEQLDAKGRYQNTLDALSSFFISLSLIHPLVMELEDGHWFDSSSKDFLQLFIRQLRDFPIFILVTSRYTDDGSKPQMMEEIVLGKNQIRCLDLDLNTLAPDALERFAELKLDGKNQSCFLRAIKPKNQRQPILPRTNH